MDVTEDAGLAAPRWAPPASYEALDCGQAEQMAGGVAVGDLDGDGDLDLYLPRMGLPGRLLANDGTGRFTPLPDLDGGFTGSGAAFGDLDGDGDLDLVVTAVGRERPRLYIQGPSGFAEEGATRGMDLLDPGDACGRLFSVALGDPDRDGDLDLHVVQWDDQPGSTRSLLLDNDGTGHFSAGSGPDLSGSAGFSTTLVDLDGDGRDAVLVAADWGGSRLFRDTGAGWVDDTAAAGVGTDDNGMGTAVGDVDGDGHLDWFVSSIYDDRQSCTVQGNWDCSGNRLYLGQADGRFVDGTDAWGVRDGGWGWGAALVDLDADGRLDLAQAGGFSVTPWADMQAKHGEALAPFGVATARLWHHQGDAMAEVSAEVGWTDAEDGRALIAFDKDGDGDQDLLIVHNHTAPTLLENRLDQGEWIAIDGLPVGTRVVAERRGAPDLIRVVPGGGAFSANLSPRVHFGFGDRPPTRLVVTWPDGTDTVVDRPDTRRVLTVERP